MPNDMSNEKFHNKAVSVLCDVQQMHEHACGLVYADDDEKISFHVFWIKWYMKRFQESLDNFEDIGF